MTDFRDNTDFDACLCGCGQTITTPVLITLDKAPRALCALVGIGYSIADLKTKHRAQLQYQSPGFIEWLESKNDQQLIAIMSGGHHG
jgi:hypothetical protein